MPDLSPAETLTAAAQKLRAAATADYVTPGPWIVHDANGFLRVDQPGPPSKAWTVKTGADLAEENRGTAEYIALMHPGVGLALAGWLEDAEERLRAAEASAVRVWANPDADDLAERAKWVAGQVNPHALAVARALLGGTS